MGQKRRMVYKVWGMAATCTALHCHAMALATKWPRLDKMHFSGINMLFCKFSTKMKEFDFSIFGGYQNLANVS